MTFQKDGLMAKILDFLSVLRECHRDTTYAKDRAIYANDIAIVASWLVDLHRSVKPEVVVGTVLDPATAKSLTDYWRQGECGERHSKAFEELRDTLRSKGDG